MKISVVVVMCHSLAGVPGDVCREEVVIKDDMPMQTCILSQAALADWKSKSIFKGDNWRIARIKCVPGDYFPKGNI